MVQVTQVRHAWPEKAGFTLERKNGLQEYVFVHFINGADIWMDGKWIYARPHSCILYNLGTPQGIHSIRPLNHDWIHFTGNMDALFLKCGLEYDKLYHPSRADFITDIVRTIEFEHYSEKALGIDLIQCKTTELFIRLSRACADIHPVSVDVNTAERFRMLRGEIFSNLNKSWTVDKMANMVGLSKSRFYTIYRNIYGNTPVNDLIQARMDSAKDMLRSGNDTLEKISETLGYNNLSHFMRQFKLETGMTPSQYRRLENSQYKSGNL